MKTLKDLPETERPREKLLLHGAMNLSDAELLAIFLRTGLPGLNAIELAQHVLNQSGGLNNLMGASHNEFIKFKGLGSAKFVQLKACMELTQRYIHNDLDKTNLMDSPDKVRDFLCQKLMHSHREIFAVLLLNTQNHLIKYEEVFFGTINSAQVHPREIAKIALDNHAKNVILAHNHPSKISEPSPSDIHITQEIKNALKLFDINVLDHIIIGSRNHMTSLAEKGII